MTVFRTMLHLAGLLALLLSATPWAQSYPSKRVLIIVANPPGGASDIIARMLSPKLGELWGQPVVIDNRPGAGNMVGAEAGARAPADGYTLLVAPNPVLTANTLLFGKLNYDPGKDFAPITQLVRIRQGIFAATTVPATTLKELVALARSKPGSLNYGSNGPGSPQHLALEFFKVIANIELTQIPYKTPAQLQAALMAGDIQLSLSGFSNSLGAIKQGRLRVLAVHGSKRLERMPDVPTFAEAGFPEMQAPAWTGLVAPAATPRAIIDRLHRDVAGFLKSREFQEPLLDQFIETVGNTPEEFAAEIAETGAFWNMVFKRANIQVN